MSFSYPVRSHLRQALDPSLAKLVMDFTVRASEATSPSKKKTIRGYEVMRAGTFHLNLSTEHVPGEFALLRLCAEQDYRVRCWLLPDAKPDFKTLPSDLSQEASVSYVSIAREIKGPCISDLRRRVDGLVSVWTDGLAIQAPAGEGVNQLEAGKVYRVEVSNCPALHS